MTKKQAKPVLAPANDPVLAPAPSEPKVISIDAGNAYTNVVTSNGVNLDIRSVQGRITTARAFTDYPFDDVIKVGADWWAFGEAAFTWAASTIEDFPATNRYTSAWYRRQLAYVFHRVYGLRTSPGPYSPSVVFSIPARLYKNSDLTEAIIAHVSGRYEVATSQNTGLIVDVTNPLCIPEGAGAMTLTASSNPNVGAGLWMVIDVGYLTTDIVFFRDGDYVKDLADSDPELGVRKVALAVSDYIMAQTGIDVNPIEVDRQLECTAMTISGRAIDVTTPRHSALTDLANGVSQFVHRVTARRNIAGAILAGGRVDLLAPFLSISPAPIMAPEPRRANGLGGLIIGS